MGLPFRLRRRVEFRDTDAAGIVHFSMYFIYMEQAEHALLREAGLSVLSRDGDIVLSWPRVNVKCDYKSAARFEDELDVEVGIARMGEKSVTYVFRFFAGERESAVGEITAVCCRFPPHGPPISIPIPDDIRRRLQPYLLPTASAGH